MGVPLRRKTREAVELVEEWAELRTLGFCYREIGELFGYSHERVRQLIGHLELAPPAVVRRQEKARAIASWLQENGPVTLNRLSTELGVAERQLMYLANRMPGVIPLHLVILNSRPTVTTYSRDELLDALREVSTRLPVSRRRGRGMSHKRYDEHRRSDQPSAAVIINRLGTWESACGAAGVLSGGLRRPKDSYGSKWSEIELLAGVAEYVRHAVAAGQKPTYTGYDRFQRSRDHLPCGATLRNRMRSLGVGTWPEIVDRARSGDAAA